MKGPRLKQSLLLLLSFLLPWLPQPSVAQKATAAATARQPMWKLKGERATVYLLGSIHTLKKEHYPMAAPIEAAFAKAKVAVFEIDIGAAEDPTTQLKLLAKVSLPAGETLRDQLSPKTYQRLTNQLDKTGVPSETIQGLRPGMVALTLLYLATQRLGYEEKLGVDRHFHQRARKDEKEIIGLETADSQMDLIAGLSKKEGEALVNDFLNRLDTIEDVLAKSITAWKAGDMKLVADLLNEDFADFPEIYKRFCVDRNRRWLPQIEALVRGNKDAIVIVGTGHLAGKESIIEMLEQKGFKITQE